MTDLVGRDRELRSLHESLDAVERGAWRAVTIQGEPGIGKTALVAELCAIARARSWTVVDARSACTAEAVAELVRTTATARSVGDGGDMGRRRTSGAADTTPLELLRSVCRPGPALVALDDLHAAGADIHALVGQLLLRPARGRLLVALAFRPAQAPRSLREVIATAVRGDLTVDVRPARLTPEQSDQLLGSHLSPGCRRELHEACGGNPLFLLAAAAPGITSAALPSTIRDLVDTELAGIPQQTRAVVEAAAVVGEPIRADLVAAILERDELDVLRALDALLDAGVIVAGDEPRTFAFRLPLVGRAVYESCDDALVAHWHARAATELAARGAPAATRARHVAMRATPGDPAAIGLLAAAGAETSIGAPAAAARWYQAALDLVPRDATGQRCDLALARAVALLRAGRLDEVRESAGEALDACPDDSPRRAVAASAAAGAQRLSGDPGGATAILDAALGAVPAGTTAAHALELQLAWGRWFDLDWLGAVAEAERLVAELRAGAPPVLQLDAAALLALGRASCGPLDGAQRAVDGAIALLERQSNARLADATRAITFLGQAAFAIERYDDAARILRRGLEVVRVTGEEIWRIGILVGLAACERWRGRLIAAEAAANAAVEHAVLLDIDLLHMWARAVRAWVRFDRGDVATAMAEAEHAGRLMRDLPPSPASWLPHCILGLARLESGDPAGAQAAILAGGGGAELPVIEPSFRSAWYEALAHASLAQGRRGEAEHWLDRAEPLIAATPLPRRRGELARGRAALLLARGEAAGAAALAAHAAECFAGHPVEAARAAILAGRALAASGQEHEARTELMSAYESLATVGAAGYRQEADEALRSLGTEPRAGDRLMGLSRRERQIADLVATGITNREIAALLNISDKTVEGHVSRALDKLGVASRAALAAEVTRERIGGRGAVDGAFEPFARAGTEEP